MLTTAVRRVPSATADRGGRRTKIETNITMPSLKPTGKPGDEKKLNFVFILIDDMGWSDSACYGSTFYETPNIDKLAGEGMRFTNAYAASSVCSPSRASIMTGQYPARLHLTDFRPSFRPSEPRKLRTPSFERRIKHDETVIAEALKTSAYISANIGKWHLAPWENPKQYYPEKHGFDVNIGGTEAGSPKSYFYPQWGDNPPIVGQENEYLTDRLTDEAEKFIEKNKDRPFFLYLSHFAVHIPLQAIAKAIAKYEAKVKPGQVQDNPIYAAMIESVDESVGRIMRKLDELGIAERTVVIFTSDNGGLVKEKGRLPQVTSNEPLREGKGHLYEGGIREPLIVRWPGAIKSGSVCDTPVCGIDFYPTLLDMAGIEIGPKKVVDGLSLAPLLKQTGGLRRDVLYWHYPHYSNQAGTPSSAIRIGDYKLIRFYEDDSVELYNLKDDIGEKHNLADKMPEKTAIFRNKLDAWLKSVNAQMPTPNPEYGS